MKKQTFAAILLTVSIVLVIITAVFAYNFLSPIKSIERLTGITLPQGISQIDSYDNLEYLVMAHAKIPDREISGLINTHNFSSELPEEYQRVIFTSANIKLRNLNFQTQFLKPENREFPSNANLYFLNGKDVSNCWIYVLDQNSGRIWVAVFYPDRSGDLFCQ